MTTSDSAARTDRIVVGVDGSEPSRHALRWAQFMASSTGADIDAVATWRMGAFAAGPAQGETPPEWNRTGEITNMLHGTLQEVFGDDRPLQVNAIVREGNAAKVLIDASKDARMLIVGSRGRGGFVGLMLGSVSTACAAHARCSVLVVHGDAPASLAS